MGKITQPVNIFMSTPVHFIAATASLNEVQARLAELRVSSLAVLDDGAVVGVVSRTDLLRVGRMDGGGGSQGAVLSLPDQTAADAMTTDMISVAVATPLAVAARQMVERRVHRVFVLSQGALAGVVSTHDIMVAVRDCKVAGPLSDFMSSPVISVGVNEPISAAVSVLDRARVSGLVVLDEQGWPVGVFTQVEALESRGGPRDAPVERVMNPSVLALPPSTALHRAAAQAAAMNVRRVVVFAGNSVAGILTGLDFAKAVAG